MITKNLKYIIIAHYHPVGQTLESSFSTRFSTVQKNHRKQRAVDNLSYWFFGIFIA